MVPPRGRAARFRRGVGAAVGALLLWPATVTASATPARADEPWVWPTTASSSPPPEVLRRFSPPRQRWAAGHRGVDLLSREGSRIYAAGPGTVRFAGPVAGRGVVVIDHGDGTRTTYEPVLATLRAGAQVRAGQQIGVLTGGPGHCLPRACLHWGRLRGPAYLDPLALVVVREPARLLPVWSTAPRSSGVPRVEKVSELTTPRAGQEESARGWTPLNAARAGPTALAWWGVALIGWMVLNLQRARRRRSS